MGGTISTGGRMTEPSGLKAFDGKKYLSLETFRQSGKGVSTPVWFAAADAGTLYAYTTADSGKAKRIRRNGSVRIAPCDARGNIMGDWVAARAALVTGQEFDRGMELLNRKYWPLKQLMDLGVRLFGRHRRVMIAISL
jgi:PPOX class probable F420-dependent enzyme